MSIEAEFRLDSRLERDCFQLGRFTYCHILLMNNAAIPWFILVPETQETEVFILNIDNQSRLLSEINLIAKYVNEMTEVSKLNIAAIGNIVNQLHVHIVGRNPNDYCWPNVVWGTKSDKKYTVDQVNNFIDALSTRFGSDFTSH